MQNPVILEDALGRVMRLDISFVTSWEVSPSIKVVNSHLISQVFDHALEVQFRGYPGHRKISEHRYVLRARSINEDLDRSKPFERCFLPGQRVDMSMIFEDQLKDMRSCPGCRLSTGKTNNGFGSEVRW